jgi:predicted nucleic acid-binding protein
VVRGSVAAAIDADVLRDTHRCRAVGASGDGGSDGPRSPAARRDLPLMARDVVHAAVVQVYGLDSIASFDRDFDKMKGLRRIDP